MLMLRSFVALALMAGIGFAESAEQPKFYKLDFVVKEIEGGRVVTSRAYSMLVATDSTGSLRAGSKVPIRTSADGSPASFIDVGTNFDCKAIKELPQHDLSLFLIAEISSYGARSGYARLPRNSTKQVEFKHRRSRKEGVRDLFLR